MINSNFKKDKLNLKEWQRFFIESDPSYGNIVASILQSIFKNKFTSLVNLSSSIEKNSSVILSGEGTVDLLLKIDNIIRLYPRFYLARESSSDISDNFTNDNAYYASMISIKCDFIITFDFYKVGGLSEEYKNEVENLINRVMDNNRKVAVRYLIKLMTYGSYFVSRDYLENEIYDKNIPYTNYKIKDIFKKFDVQKFSNFGSLISSANIDDSNNIISNIKVLSIPFTAYHADKYVYRDIQHIYREKYNIGKKELKVKLLYLNADYFVLEKAKSIYDLLVNKIYTEYFNEDNDTDSDGFNFGLEKSKEKNKILNISEIDEEYDRLISKKAKIDKSVRKNMIFKVLKNDKLVSKHDLDLLETIDLEKLHVKKNFVNVVNYLSNPFLSKFVNTSSLRFLRQYITTNYGENLTENVSEEVKMFVEKKLFDFIQSKSCFFIEYFSNAARIISESINERQFLVETVIKNSILYKNLFFTKYLVKPRKISTKIFSNLLNIIGNEYFTFLNDGVEDDLVVIPFIKMKEFMVYLIKEEINSSWEKLSNFFNDLSGIMSSNVYHGSIGEIEIKMTAIHARSYEILVKEKLNTNHFNIATRDDIEFIFQDKEHDKLKNLLNHLIDLHEKIGFGFDSKKDYNELIELYNKRCNDYFFYKHRDEKYDEKITHENKFLEFLKRLFFWFPRSFNEYHLYKTMKKNRVFDDKVSFYYQKERKVFVPVNKEILDIKQQISNLIDSNTEKKKLRKKQKKDECDELLKENKKNKSKKKTPLIQLIELEDEEKKLFDYIKDYIIDGKDVIFTHNPDILEEKIVIYVKEKVKAKPLFMREDLSNKDINTIDEYVTRYFNLKRLIDKHYLVQKEIIKLANDKKIYILFLSKLYAQLICAEEE